MKWFTDGAGWNGKVSRWAVSNDAGLERITVKHERITNNQAEYSAMKEALKMASDGDEICSDSELIVYQLTGKYKTKDVKLKPLREQCRNLLNQKKVRLVVVRREENKAGKLLERTV
jgi:ribonuclease HI